jgi:hypothetical protein
MKFRYLYLIFLYCLSIAFIPTKPLNVLIIDNDCQTILDSAEVFVKTSESAVNYEPTINDPERNLRLDKWLQKLSFRNLSCLLDNKSISLKVLGFIYAANSHRDSLLKYYSYLLTDTTTVQLFMADGKTSPKIKLGELLSATTQQIKEKNDNFEKRPQIEDVVLAFIRQYSTYPSTYRPISFPYFSMGSDNEGLTDFKIHHDYEIKNNEGINVRVISAFVLDKNLKINIIEKDSTSYSYSYPPKLEYWFKEFGRKLTKNDSLTLKFR